MKLALCLVVAVAGCATEAVPVTGSASPGMKRQEAASTRPSLGKHRSRHPSLRVSRSLRRSPVAQTLVVTAYCYTGSRNAAGKWPSAGTAAANAYPLGTRLLISGYGVVTVEDRSAPNATDVDIYMGDEPNCAARAAAWGRRLLHVSEAAA